MGNKKFIKSVEKVNDNKIVQFVSHHPTEIGLALVLAAVFIARLLQKRKIRNMVFAYAGETISRTENRSMQSTSNDGSKTTTTTKTVPITVSVKDHASVKDERKFWFCGELTEIQVRPSSYNKSFDQNPDVLLPVLNREFGGTWKRQPKTKGKYYVFFRPSKINSATVE